MAEKAAHPILPLLRAIAFASRAHQGQLRKDGATPYASHVVRVGFILRDVFGVSDREALTAAVLHDTIEDTTTDFDDLEEEFGGRVAGWVALLTKDSTLPHDRREEAYTDRLRSAPWQVRVCKLADIFDNVLDTASLPPAKRARTYQKARNYLDALRHDLPEEARRPWEVVSDLLARIEAGEAGRSGA